MNNASEYSGCSEEDTDSATACGCFSPRFQQIIGPCIQSTCDEAASARKYHEIGFPSSSEFTLLAQPIKFRPQVLIMVLLVLQSFFNKQPNCARA